MTILNKLTTWQKAQARREGIEGYRVLPFKTLQAIAQTLPRNEEELLAIKGLGPVKVRKYGQEILAMVAGGVAPQERGTKVYEPVAQANIFQESAEVNALLDAKEAVVAEGDAQEKILHNTSRTSDDNAHKKLSAQIDVTTGEIQEDRAQEIMSVSDFLLRVNRVLGSYFTQVKIRGEIIGFKRNANGHAYFEIKDDDAIVRVSVFRNVYELCGIDLADGMEIVVTGTPEHHARFGFSVIGSFVEVAGEGALKKAYDALKKKLSAEGLFLPEHKRAIPALPQRIGLITSPTGAALGDFTTNVGTYGYTISFYPSRVEGAQAVKELLRAIDVLKKQNLDVLVVTRGGGSLESLAAFNNENVVRALATFPVPVIAGIGHEQDETLSTLVADVGVSTPTAAARTVRESWDHAVAQHTVYQERILNGCERIVRDIRSVQDQSVRSIAGFFDQVRSTQREQEQIFATNLHRLKERITQLHRRLDYWASLFAQHNPVRLLKLGYSITRDDAGNVVRSIHDTKKDAILEIQLSDGRVSARRQS